MAPYTLDEVQRGAMVRDASACRRSTLVHPLLSVLQCAAGTYCPPVLYPPSTPGGLRPYALRVAETAPLPPPLPHAPCPDAAGACKKKHSPPPRGGGGCVEGPLCSIYPRHFFDGCPAVVRRFFEQLSKNGCPMNAGRVGSAAFSYF